jgi:3',5'-cyclic-AMP phosphodiesterase
MKMTRRELIGSAAAGATALATPAWARTERGARRVLRVAHLTDIHILPRETARKGFAAALRQVYEMQDRPDLILQGGDAIMDALAADEASTSAQWREWDAVLRDFTEIPIRHRIGNHDVWGWNKRSSKTTGAEDLWGKRWALERFGMSERYEAFDMGGWRFVLLDDIAMVGEGGGYEARLDEGQMEWLKAELSRTPAETPIAIMSHIPIISACGFFEKDGGMYRDGNWHMPGSWMHVDANELKNLFWRHRNVKLCLSGHMHQVDLIQFNGVTYYCSGAVSGAWWGGRYYECDPGIGLIDLYEDGRIEARYEVSPPPTPSSSFPR